MMLSFLASKVMVEPAGSSSVVVTWTEMETVVPSARVTGYGWTLSESMVREEEEPGHSPCSTPSVLTPDTSARASSRDSFMVSGSARNVMLIVT